MVGKKSHRNALSMCHSGPLFLISPSEAPSSLGCSVAALTLSSPVLQSDQMKNEKTGGGDIHRYSMPPLFSGSIVVCRLPQRP